MSSPILGPGATGGRVVLPLLLLLASLLSIGGVRAQTLNFGAFCLQGTGQPLCSLTYQALLTTVCALH